MSPETGSRPYQLRKRADAMQDTRRRITEAAVELHGSIGPARTTLSAVAERAGVQRQTVYRHFPTEDDLFAACSQHFYDRDPPPDLGRWRETADPAERLAAALDELYAYYERTEGMYVNLFRDETLKVVGFFCDSRIVSTFVEPLEPIGQATVTMGVPVPV